MTVESATFDQQYAALRTSGGIVELHNWSSMSVTGKDRQQFLNNFCTNDVKRLTVGQSCEAFFTNVKGKIVGHGLIICRENELVTIGVPSQAASLIQHLDHYLIREDVQLRDTTPERTYLLVAGGSVAKERLVEFHSAAGMSLVASEGISWNLVGSEVAELLELPPHELPTVCESLCNHALVVAGTAFVAARIEAGVPLFLVDFDETNFPQEVGRDREAISFTKGCYLGQETVARIDALGHVNQRLVGVRFLGDEMPAPEMELLHAGKTAGQVTSFAFSPRLNAPLALAMVRREANSPGTRLDSPVGACEVVSLPL